MAENSVTRPSTLTLLFVGLAVMFGIFWLWQRPDLDPDHARIVAERSKRLAITKRSETLPGTPDLADLSGRLSAHGLKLGAPMFVRIFKREFELEVWMKRDDRFHLFATYPVCRWSGELGPKMVEGDGQSPEGFYTIDRRAMNANSRWHRSFNLGFPNAFDKAHGRTGSFLMVHGGCSSVGCFAMTNPVVDELWKLVDSALKGGQKQIHVHVFPFRLSDDNLAARADRNWAPFWRELKAGYDAFDATQVPPRVSVCRGRYLVERQDEDRGSPGPIAVSTAGLTGTACEATGAL